MPAVSNRSRRPRELYEAPHSRWIAEFVGDINLVRGPGRDAGEGRTDLIDLRRAMPEPSSSPSRASRSRKAVVCVAIRPEKVKLSRRGPVSDADNAHAINRLEGVVTDVSYLGGFTTYKVKLDSRRCGAFVDGQHRAARYRRL